MKVYTLPVIDTDGEITGNKGAVIGPSELLVVTPFDEVAPGQAVLDSDFPYNVPDELIHVRLSDGEEFRRTLVTRQPNPFGEFGGLQRAVTDVLTVWERRVR